MSTEGNLDITLDDAAAFFVQLEKNDLSELAQLKEMLDGILDSESCSESSREDIKKAVQTIEGILFKYISDTDSAIEKVGRYINSAINAADEIENRGQEDTFANEVKSQSDEQNDENLDQARDDEDSASFQIPDSAFADFIDEFVVEGIDLIASAEEALLVLENNLLDMDALDTVFRAFHSIKGSAALLKFDIINELAHQSENLLDRMRCEEIQCTGGYADLVFKSLDMLREFFNIIKNASAGESQIKPVGYDELIRFLENPDEYSGDEVNGELPTEVSSEQDNVEKKVVEDLQNCMPEEIDFDLVAEFLTEGSDLISNAEEALIVLERDPSEISAVNTVFRAFHTIKGTSGFLGLTLLAKIGHYAETLLSRVRDGEIRYEGVYADLALRALDMIKVLMNNVERSLNGETFLKPDGYDELVEMLKILEKSLSAENNPEGFESQTADNAICQGKNESEQPEEMEAPRLGDILVSQGKIDRKTLEKIVANKGDKPIGEAILECKAATATDVNQAISTQLRIRGENQKTIQASIRVATDRLDRLINTVGELVIAYSMVSEDDIVARSQDHEFQKKVSHASKIVRELQTMTMSLRMVPLKSTFNKMSRLVRDVSKKFGKKVNFIIEGEDTEIDRNMADAIKDPLVHMVRNAVDHGIEEPNEREKIGKPKEGIVKLSAYHSAGSVVVEIEDDGKGLDQEMILTKSIERGLISEDTSLSEREIFNMIFEPGFSTAKAITDVSGRGVGMDVVRKNIEAIRGQTEIQSELGKGSLFQMRLPLTLAIIDGMVIRVGSETYVIPTTSIVTSIKPEPGSISTVLHKGEMLTLQGKLIPLLRLRHLFNVKEENENKDIRLVVVVEEKGRLTGLVIDELIGRQQVVIKTLGETMRNIHGIAGGAIMPNGRVGLIMDVGGVVKLANTYDGEKVVAAA